MGSDFRLILASEGGLATRNSFSHSRLFRKQQIGRGKLSPLMAFDEAFGEWEARMGHCRPPALAPPGRGLAEDAAVAQAITAIALQEALSRLWPRKRWTMDFPRDDIDREDGSGLEFEYQLNTPSLARLYQLKELGRTYIMELRRTLRDKQDLIRMVADDFVEEGYNTTRGGWLVRASAEECSRLCIQCGRAWSARQVDSEG